jgi:DNA-binding CsgD family transcriptional regulator
MAVAKFLLSSQDFERMASTLQRWSAKSLGVARSLLVDGLPLGEVAKAHAISPQQANIIRKRFLEKVEKDRIDAFMSREKPENEIVDITPYTREIKMLSSKGYTSEQIALYLKENSLATTSPKDIDSLLKGQP